MDDVIDSPGVRVTIHSQDDTPFPEDSGFDIQPGRATSVGILMGRTQRLPKPYTNCISDNIPTYDTAFGDIYSVKACMKSCLAEELTKACNCTDSRYPPPSGYGDVGHCSSDNIEHRMCRRRVDLSYQTNKIQCDCPPKCEYVSYAKEAASTVWPAIHSGDYIREFLKSRSSKLRTLMEQEERTGLDLLRQNVLKLQVYFRDLHYSETIQSPSYTSLDLLSDIGGNLGLWIGLSVLTLLEFIEFTYDMIYLLLLRCITRKRSPMDVQREAGHDGPYSSYHEHNTSGQNGVVNIEQRRDKQPNPSGYYTQSRANHPTDNVYYTNDGGNSHNVGVYYMQKRANDGIVGV
ncbi:amiloride-sensitive sodium channel subunit beta-like isoform X2 [Ptychodera flava]